MYTFSSVNCINFVLPSNTNRMILDDAKPKAIPINRGYYKDKRTHFKSDIIENVQKLAFSNLHIAITVFDLEFREIIFKSKK